MAAVQTSSSTSNPVAATKTSASTTNSKPSYEELEKRYQALEAKLKVAEAANTEIQNVNDVLAKRMDAMEQEKKREKVASIVQGAYDEADDVEARIDDLIKSGMSLEGISKLVAPLLKAKQQGAAAANNNNNNKTKQASVPGYTSTVAIHNEPGEANGRKEIPAYAANWLDLVNGGGGA